ncbi:MAG: hypothetical protein ACLQVD_09885, partial [Capsulimonadaceae bacterium]
KNLLNELLWRLSTRPEGGRYLTLTCAAYRPGPQAGGNLQVDPEIYLPSPGMDLKIGMYYNSVSQYNGPLGFGRTMLPNCLAQASGSPLLVTLTRGTGAVATYQDDGSGTFVNSTAGNFNTLTQDTTDGLWLETTPDGYVAAYPLDTAGNVTTIMWTQSPVGVTHPYSYASGLLQNIQDGVGRLATFLYSGGLLQTIQDWAGRVTTLAYDTSVPAMPLLATLMGPTGCQTQYQHDSSGLLLGIIDPNGYATSYTYDDLRRAVTRVIPAAGAMSTDTHEGPSQPQNVVSMQDVLGNVTTTTVDISGLIGATIDPLGNAVSRCLH